MAEHIVLITNIPTPYRVPLFNVLQDRCKKTGRTLKVIFLATTYKRRNWEIDTRVFEFDFEFLRSPTLGFRESFFSLSFDLFPKLVRENPDKIVTAGFSLPSLIAFLFCRLYQRKFVLWSGEIAEKAEKRRSFFGFRHLLRRFLAERADSAICYGSRAKDYMVTLGSQNNYVAINTVDTVFFRTEIERIEKSGKKSDPAFSGKNVLYVGNVLFEKGIRELISAFAITRKNHPELRLHIVGDGSDRPHLESLVKEKNIEQVTFWGFHQLGELPRFYSYCDVFVFPSFYDVWGLVLNEALCAMQPIVASVYAGATRDLVFDGENGFVCRPEDEPAFAEFIERAMYDESLRRNAKRKSLELLDSIGLSNSVEGFLKALEGADGK